MDGEYIIALEKELRTVVNARTFPLDGDRIYDEFLNMLRFHLGWADTRGRPIAADPGKRIRPLLCLLSCEAAAEEPIEQGTEAWRRAVPAATAIELVHNFSLIHDDIEDNSSERRGRAALWTVWGTAQGINAGDAMFVLARLALDRLQNYVDAATFASVHIRFDEATLALTQGQFLDICFEKRRDVAVEDYLGMVRGKTAALLAASTEIGARIGTTDDQVVQAFARYGQDLGIAFQIVDDILGIWGDPAITGKSAASDILARKKSLPILIAASSSSGQDLTELFARPNLGEKDVKQALRILEGAGARDLAQSQADAYLGLALDALAATGREGHAVEQLRDLAHSATRRLR